MIENLGQGNELWKFALTIYAEQGFSVSCIELQDNCNVDVCVLIAAIHARSKGITVSTEIVEAARRLVDPWRREVVLTIRTARRALKARSRDGAAVADLYARLKEDELSAEQLQLGLLESWWAKQEKMTHICSWTETIELVVSCYSEHGDHCESTPSIVKIATIAQALSWFCQSGVVNLTG